MKDNLTNPGGYIVYCPCRCMGDIVACPVLPHTDKPGKCLQKKKSKLKKYR